MAAFLQQQAVVFLLLSILASASYLAEAEDPSQLQDYCIADINSQYTINGFACKNPTEVTSEDFFFNGLANPASTDNPFGFNVTIATVDQYPALNTLGITIARVDYAPNGGLNPPHIHPRAAEIVTVLEGELYTGFVSSNPDNKLYAKMIKKGEVFVIPQGLIHFQLNVGKTIANTLVSFTSQNPGSILIAEANFGSNPLIDPSILAKAFNLDSNTVKDLEAIFA